MEHLTETEPRRLAALLELGVLDSAPEPIFDSLTELALRTFDVPVAVISLVDKDRQWFKSCIGLPVTETPRDVAFCDHTIRRGAVMVVPDAAADPRFASNPLVTGEPGIRFYAGAPLTTPDGYRIGTLCLIDVAPRATFDPDEAAKLQHIAEAVMQALMMRAQASASARKTAEAEEKADLLGLSERLAKVGYWIWDPASDQTVWSPETYRIHGIDPSGPAPALDGVLALYQADDAAALAACVERAVTLGESYDLESRIIRPDGEIRHVVTSAAARRDSEGRVCLLQGSFQDITELRLADAKLRDSEKRYRLLADNAMETVVAYDLEGRITYASPSLRRYGHDPDGMVGGHIGQALHPDDRPILHQAFQRALTGQTVTLERLRATDADRRWAWFEGQISPMYDDEGELVGALAAQRDVSARLAAEHALNEVNAELTRVARISALGAFSASIAHEINQPLTALVTNSETALIWLAKDPPNLPMAESAIKRGAQDALRASEIIARMRSLVTRGPSRVAEFDVNDAIREVLSLTATERLREKIAAKAEVTPHPLMIHGDRIQVQQVLLNLIGNAIEAMRDAPEEERRLLVRSSTVGDGQVLVEIEDRGTGLDPHAADHIFDHLFTTKTGGTGLGLSISKSIIESHGGRIWAEAAAPKGAVFRFQLPKSGEAEAAA